MSQVLSADTLRTLSTKCIYVQSLHTHRVMSAALGVPATQHAYEDAALQFAARKLNHRMSTGIVVWGSVKSELQITTTTAKEYLRVFTELDKNNDGRLRYRVYI
jgi:hypothetical protein